MNLKKSLVTLLAATALLCAALPAGAQQMESRIVGIVTDQSGAVLPGVSVTAVATATGATRAVVTEAEGRYTITNLAAGQYQVTVELSGFTSVRRDVTLGVGDAKTTDVALNIGGMSEAVTVSGEMPVLDLASAKIGVNVSPDEIANLPVNGRNFTNLMTLATGATSDGNGGWASVRFNGKSNHPASRSRRGRQSLPPERCQVAEPGSVRNAAAGDVWQPPEELPEGTELLAARPDGQQGHPVLEQPGAPVQGRGVQHRQPVELRESGALAAQWHPGGAIHRRADRNFRVHARAADSHRRDGHRPTDAGVGPLSLLAQPAGAQRDA